MIDHPAKEEPEVESAHQPNEQDLWDLWILLTLINGSSGEQINSDKKLHNMISALLVKDLEWNAMYFL